MPARLGDLIEHGEELKQTGS